MRDVDLASLDRDPADRPVDRVTDRCQVERHANGTEGRVEVEGRAVGPGSENVRLIPAGAALGDDHVPLGVEIDVDRPGQALRDDLKNALAGIIDDGAVDGLALPGGDVDGV